MRDRKNEITEDDITRSVEILRSGGVILYPTDTIWGLGCDPSNEEAIEKVYQLKRRPAEKSMIILVDSVAMLERYTSVIHEVVYELIEAEERPLTLVLPAAGSLLCPSLISPEGFIAVRICRDEFCSSLIGRFRKPVVSTSANLSGEPPPEVFSDIMGEIVTGADYVVSHRRNDTRRAKPSPVIKIDESGVIKILRQ
ncbi:MAG: L-threonylcarbamoyladenylate synthase [Bacteroidales bacterium]